MVHGYFYFCKIFINRMVYWELVKINECVTFVYVLFSVRRLVAFDGILHQASGSVF